MKYYSKHVIIIIIKTREPYQNPEISNLIKTLDLIKTLNSSQKTDS